MNLLESITIKLSINLKNESVIKDSKITENKINNVEIKMQRNNLIDRSSILSHNSSFKVL